LSNHKIPLAADPQANINNAELVWNDQGHPHSSLFNDHYYSLSNGLEETNHVFIKGNHLLRRWKELSDEQCFCIMETGFGSGLNFLSTWQLWNKYKAGQNNILHYISVEAYPMTLQQLQKSLDNWKDKLSEFSVKLLAEYPPLKVGNHEIHFEADNVKLTLLFGDIREQLPAVDCTASGLVDAWFLDGFSPSKNPEMWEDSLYTQMHRLSKQGATVATYTVAGIVRRGLTAAGFQVSRKPGFGTKRDMLYAQLDQGQSSL